MRTIENMRKDKLILEALKDLCATSDRAPSASAVHEFLESRKSGVARSFVQTVLLDMYDRGEIERRKIGQYSYYRVPGGPPWPIDFNQLIENVVISFNSEGILPLVGQVAERANCSKDTASKVLSRLGDTRYDHRIGAIRRPGARNLFGYISNRPEFAKLREENEADKPLQRVSPKFVNYGSAILRKEWKSARKNTHPGDLLRVLKRGETSVSRVKYVMPNICVFEDGECVKWSDVELYYRNKRPIPISERGI